VVGCWHGYLSGADLHMAQLMPLPLTVSCFSKIQIISFIFLVPAHPASPGQRAVKQVFVCKRVCLGAGRKQKDKCMFLLYVDANSLVNSKGPTNTASSATVATSGGGVAMEFTVKELYAIEEIHSETHLLRLITGLVHLFSFSLFFCFHIWFHTIGLAGFYQLMSVC